MTESDTSPEPSESTAMLRRALIELRREQFQAALEHFDAALQLDPNMAAVHAYHSGAMLALGRPLDAQADIVRALELDPHGFASNQKAGELNLRFGDLGSAADYFLAAVRAARPGSADEKAAMSALALARVRQKSSISHHAQLPGHVRLPGIARLASLARRPRWLPSRMRRESREIVTG